ncbi:hypothetical protein [Mesorhizobium sp.]|uniref:hypothetical protein n=1 Tax=Mesorhizobium sp. TaxID=1871066 RepID=UPI00121C01CA|nr:MAG: hypothetical protein E5V40_14260 [Mesorhizobium sp.]
MEHLQRAQNLKLVERIATPVGNGKTSVQSHARRIFSTTGEHQGHPEGGLKKHLLRSAACSVVEGKNRPRHPTMTFGEQRHRQKNRGRRRG